MNNAQECTIYACACISGQNVSVESRARAHARLQMAGSHMQMRQAYAR